MSNRELAKTLIDQIPESQLFYVISYLQGITADESEDDAFCSSLYKDYIEDQDPHKHDTVSLETLAADLGVVLP